MATNATENTNFLANPVAYFRISGIALAAVAVLGIIMSAVNKGGFIDGFLEFDWTHNIVHILLAAIGILLGFGNIASSVVKTFAIVLGAVYVVLGVVGFISVDAFILGGLGFHLELGENLVHLIIGAYGLTAGLMAKA